MNGNKNGFFESPYRKEIQQLSSYSKLVSLNKKRIEEMEGNNNDWLIKVSKGETPIPTPSTELENNPIYQKLKSENKQLWDTMRLINSGRGKVLIADVIKTPEQAKIAIEFLLWETQINWRRYLESIDKDKFEKHPVLGLAFDIPEKRAEGEKVLDWIILTLGRKMTYEELIKKWNNGDEYNYLHDYDAGSLLAFNQLMEIKNPPSYSIPKNF